MSALNKYERFQEECSNKTIVFNVKLLEEEHAQALQDGEEMYADYLKRSLDDAYNTYPELLSNLKTERV